MLRHVGFARKADFEAFHARNGPAHSYYSTAFYDRPDAPTMKEKGWLGAELIFDLDADHVPGAEKLTFPQQLAKVKHHFLRLVDGFILGDFGFEEQDLLLTFSGGRGYHCHVLASKALELTSQERREIVDYVTGTGLELDRHMWVEKKSRERQPGERGFSVPTLRVSAQADSGWGGRLNAALVSRLKSLHGMDVAALAEEARVFPSPRGKELSDVGRAKLAAELRDELDRLTEAKVANIQRGYADQGNLIKKLLPHVFHQQVIPLAKGETDEPVTSDTKRLIRTPGSLHGKTGLRVVALRRDELDEFEPLRDAVAFSDETVQLEVTKPIDVRLGGLDVKLEPGKARVAEAGAVFAVLRGAARPV